MRLVIIILVKCIYGYATKEIIKGKGYAENWFWWGFFFGLIALVVALCKEDIRNKDESKFDDPAKGSCDNDEKLKKYKVLLDKGEISREEYEYWKQETLDTSC
ncbi:hypothetical protein SAMN04487884_14614 [Butyrivibrio fibrisolvens]|uniref:SHOCT domain-containing protein n=1 Tax=Butyrivibrio fibrisolvens TaxID=831 RepID=A0A1H9X6U9_BUTFI|nr:SHOCT domain-containing protein [Butyrivibrio fibrisolvens]SES41854.1 hypothetical protein SAMN04487884_14614 [Butyrivibrio fibrisolvens]